MKKKIIALLLTLALVVAMTSQAFAADIKSDSVESCTVTLVQESDYTVTIPKFITLDGRDGSGWYELSISGNLSGTETLSVIPSEKISLSQSGKSNITVYIDQYSDEMDPGKIEWSSDEVAMGVVAYGDIHVAEETPITAGNWQGTMYFDIRVNDYGVVPKPSEPDTPSKPSGTRIQSWDASVRNDNSVVAGLYNDNGHYSLVITGSGEMKSFGIQTTPPWCSATYVSLFESIVIDSGVTNVGVRAFQGCSAVTSVTLSNTVTTIGGSAFKGLTSLKSVEIPKSVKTIEAYAFTEDSLLETVTVRATGLTSVGDGAFTKIASNSKIYVPNNNIMSLFVADKTYTSGKTTVSVNSALAS